MNLVNSFDAHHFYHIELLYECFLCESTKSVVDDVFFGQISRITVVFLLQSWEAANAKVKRCQGIGEKTDLTWSDHG